MVDTELEPWREINTTPKNCGEFEGLDKNGNIHIVHYACDLSGSDQPAFKGYFKWMGDNDGGYYAEQQIVKWRPISELKLEDG